MTCILVTMLVTGKDFKQANLFWTLIHWLIFREHNMIRFHDGEPTGIYYSQHSDGAAYDWNDEILSMADNRVR